jgi:hypothetical protein
MSFLKGLKYANPSNQYHDIQLIILNQTLVQNKLMLTFEYLEEKTFNLSVISFSYLIFTPSHSKFASYGGIVSKNNFIGNYSNDISDIILPSVNYHFYGVTSISLNTTHISFDS